MAGSGVKAKAVAGLVALVAVVKLLAGGLELYSQGQYDQALAQFQKILSDHPPTPYTDDAVYWSGRCYLKLGKPASAEKHFQRLLSDHPDSEFAAGARVGLGFLKDRWDPANLAEVGPWDYLRHASPRTAVASYFFAARAGDLPSVGQLLVPTAREALATALAGAKTPETRRRVASGYGQGLATATNFRIGPAVLHLDNPSLATVEVLYTDADGKSSIRQIGVARIGKRWFLQSPF